MQKGVYFVLMAITLLGCSYDYNIDNLEHRELEYKCLPISLQKYMLSLPDCDPSLKNLLVVDSTEVDRYHIDDIKTITGPWIAFLKLTDDKEKYVYRIDRDLASPYIIYADKLYIPDRYNLFCGEDFRNAVYTEYQLK